MFGKPNPALGLANRKISKADLIAVLKEAFAWCDSAFAGLTDAQLAETLQLFGRGHTKATVLAFHTAHNNEHCGNIVTCLRLKGIVPPCSERR